MADKPRYRGHYGDDEGLEFSRIPPEESPEDDEPGFDDEPPPGETFPVITEEYGRIDLTPRNASEESTIGAWYQAVGGYLSGAEHYDKDGNLIDYAARIESFAGQTIDGHALETRPDMIEYYAAIDEIPDGPYDK